MNTALQFFLNISLWGILLCTFFAIFIVLEAGVFLGKRHRLASEQEDRSPIGSVVAAALGLLAFLLAFTFSMSASKFEERRGLVLEEANAIGTTYLRAKYLEEPYQNRIKDLLKEYVSIRLDAVNLGKVEEGIKKSEELQDQLWQQAINVAKKSPDSVVVGLFIQSLNEVIDLHAKRVHIGTRIRLPLIIWGVLYFVAFLALGCLGYQFGLARTNYLGASLLIILTFSCVIALIADLDRPQEGLIRVSQQSLVDLMNKFNQNKQAQ